MLGLLEDTWQQRIGLGASAGRRWTRVGTRFVDAGGCRIPRMISCVGDPRFNQWRRSNDCTNDCAYGYSGTRVPVCIVIWCGAAHRNLDAFRRLIGQRLGQREMKQEKKNNLIPLTHIYNNFLT
uniref:Uncharacterized protein n=1 Tax=Lupinus angustifolius TaxID=3871 RepID=A0A0D6DQE0_LUPAN|nr:unknown protein [Lupinus angustifolius]